ncbi:hypothetical protein GVN20_21715 [Runella sp. CRIBMP]|uniref:toprim domain-containing protein n=1 Tax=Runella sp. CRIBMP TaxID=2683261 RepID=UPI00141276EC|nr:toprim domain-containing protein [Runella sp. CRIBMP]NBB21990.1 hypothetical protein [Runella sp. CRIBMP]
MQDVKNRASREQLAILRHLNKEAVRYIAFGDFALNGIDNTRTIGNVQLWIEPTPDNVEKCNKAIKNMYGARSITQLPQSIVTNPEAKRTLTLGSGEVRVAVYPAISGFHPAEFNDLYQRGEKSRAYLPSQTGKLDGSVGYKQLNMSDLYHNIRESKSVHKAWNLETIERFAAKNDLNLKKPDGSEITERDKIAISLQTQRKGGRLTRDMKQIKQDLDLEIVLQHYGYQLDKKKSRPNDAWRLYETGIKGDKHRLAVAAVKDYGMKFFVDLNDPQFKGDIFKFMECMEHGNYRHIFQTIDSIMMQDGFAEKKRMVEPMIEVPANYFLKDTLLREQDLYSKYQIVPLTDTDFLEGRSISKEVLFSKEFEGRIKNVSFDTGVIRYVNTAFPMYARDGNIASMDIRSTAYKAFPEGERGEALWHSNRFFEAKEAITGENGQEIPQCTIGTIYRQDGKSAVFMYQDSGEEKRAILPIEKAKTGFYEIPVQRIIILESAIDAISLKQLNPEQANERRFYVATGGQPGGKQLTFLQEILNRNPQAQLVIAQDGDNAGLRFAVNYLGLAHPSENPEMKIKPYLTYSSPSNQQIRKTEGNTENYESVGTNRLNLELRYPLALGARKAKELNEGFIKDLVEDMNLFVNRYSTDLNDKEKKINEFQRETMIDESMKLMITRTVIHFPNDSKLLTKVLNRISDEIEKRQGQKLFKIVRPTLQQKDFNDVLRERNGQALPPSHNLILGEPPIIRPYQEVQKIKNTESQGFIDRKNRIDF